MSIQEQFDHLFKRNGGRLDLEIITRGFERQLLEKHLERARSIVDVVLKHGEKIGAKPVSIYVDLVDRSYVNAGAQVLGKQGFIGINSGAIYGLYDLFYRMLSHPEVAKEIGDAKSEQIRPWHSQGLSRDYGHLVASRPIKYRGLDDAAPLHALRRAAAESLATCALDFLVAHEVTHIINGHCGYANSLGLALLMEVDGESEDKIPPLERQLIELDADSSAINFQITNAIADSHPALSRIQFEVTRWYLACAPLLLTLGMERNYDAIYKDRYPQDADRCYMNWNYAMTVLRGEAGLDLSPLRGNAMTNVYVACCMISDNSMPAKIREMHFSFDEKKNNLWHSRLSLTWQELRPKLLDFSFNPKLLDNLINV